MNFQNLKGTLLKCHTCDQEFISKWNLMNHRRENHPSSKTCRYFLTNTCKFTDGQCWYKHENVRATDTENATGNIENKLISINCFVCGKSFENRKQMMEHKNIEHPSNIICRDYLQNKCRDCVILWCLDIISG